MCMDIEEKDDLIRTIVARFGDLHEFSFEELVDKSVDELKEIAYKDSDEPHR